MKIRICDICSDEMPLTKTSFVLKRKLFSSSEPLLTPYTKVDVCESCMAAIVMGIQSAISKDHSLQSPRLFEDAEYEDHNDKE